MLGAISAPMKGRRGGDGKFREFAQLLGGSGSGSGKAAGRGQLVLSPDDQIVTALAMNRDQ
jgi:hypothetical protein